MESVKDCPVNPWQETECESRNAKLLEEIQANHYESLRNEKRYRQLKAGLAVCKEKVNDQGFSDCEKAYSEIERDRLARSLVKWTLLASVLSVTFAIFRKTIKKTEPGR